MDLVQVKKYLKDHKLATLQDIATHFRTDPGAVAPLLDIWVGKGKLKRHNGNLGCRKGCCQCDPAAVISYEWVD